MSSESTFDDDYDGFFLDEEESTRRERAAFAELLPRATEKCSQLNLRYEVEIDEDLDKTLRVYFKSGRVERSVWLFDSSQLHRFIDLDLEKTSYLDGYDGVCDYANGFIEVGIQVLGAQSSINLQRIFFSSSSDTANPISLSSNVPGQSSISIGKPSDKFKFLIRGVPKLTIRMDVSELNGQSAIIDRLIRISNSLFFQIDLLFNVPLSISRSRDPLRKGLPRGKRRTITQGELAYPTQEYDAAPISLYWYGRSAAALPLLRFLAFYQAVEFYYPIFSRAEVAKRIRLILKDPVFRPDKDADVSRIVSAVSINRSGGLLDERSQLRAVINECMTSDMLRSFIQSEQDMLDFYKNDFKKVHKHKINVNDANLDMRNDVAERLYGIRCKIVHTKHEGGDDVELLLPFTNEERLLVYDIELMQFVARSVLTAAGSALG